MSQINDTAFVGYQKQGTFTLSNVTTEEGIPFSGLRGRQPAVADRVAPLLGAAPGKGNGVMQMTYLLRSEFMTAGQTYTATIQITATDPSAKGEQLPVPAAHLRARRRRRP